MRLWLPASIDNIASFPGSPALEYEYVGRAWYLFSHEHDVIRKGQNKKAMFYTVFIQVCAQCSVSLLASGNEANLLLASLMCEVSHPLPLSFLLL